MRVFCNLGLAVCLLTLLRTGPGPHAELCERDSFQMQETVHRQPGAKWATMVRSGAGPCAVGLTRCRAVAHERSAPVVALRANRAVRPHNSAAWFAAERSQRLALAADRTARRPPQPPSRRLTSNTPTPGGVPVRRASHFRRDDDPDVVLLKRLDPSLAKRNPRSIEEVTVLRLSDSSVNDEQVRCIAGATRLERLDLDATAVTGKGLRRIAHLDTIIQLNLTGTNVTDDDMGTLKSLGSLMILTLNRTAVGGRAASWLERCTQLRSIWISGTAITDRDLDALASCKNLESITAEHCRLNGSFLRVCKGLPKLSTVVLNGARTFDGAAMVHLENHPALWSLSLIDTAVGDKDADHLARLPRLTTLWLSGTRVTDRAVRTIAGIKTLDSLSLSDTMITDTGLLHLRGARGLRYLDVSGTHVSLDGMQELRRSLKDLELDYSYPPRPVEF
jgi:hypothetical protein